MKNSKKTIKVLFLCTFIFLFYNCKKEDANPSQNFFESFLADSLFKAPKSFTDPTYYSYGFMFQANKAGSITKVGIKNPKPASYALTIWDADTKAVIFTKNIEQEQADKKNWVSITPIKLEANKKYLFSQVSNSYYAYYPKAASNKFTYPYSKNNLVILGYYNASTKLGNPPVFPANFVDTFIAGDADFTFQPD